MASKPYIILKQFSLPKIPRLPRTVEFQNSFLKHVKINSYDCFNVNVTKKIPQINPAIVSPGNIVGTALNFHFFKRAAIMVNILTTGHIRDIWL